MVGWHDVWSVTREKVYEQSDLSDYTSYGTDIKAYEISDKSAVEALCPNELIENRPYVDAFVETYRYSGREGAEGYLFVGGDPCLYT